MTDQPKDQPKVGPTRPARGRTTHPRPTSTSSIAPSSDVSSLVGPLVSWFVASARDLPWRRPDPALGPPFRDPYRSLVSEFMLQQTQVSRVEPKFNDFLTRFPTIASLAAAPEQDVLAAWAGLGYYRRARLLHAAAKRVVEVHQGTVPRDVETLRTLPGVGRYTAGAIASMACAQNAPIVDANVARVLVRIAGVELRHATPDTLNWAWTHAEPLANVAHDRGVIGPFNEGLMELGATICTPTNPKCGQCPIARFCVARAENRQHLLPLPKPRQERRAVTHLVVVLRDRAGRVLVERRGEGSTWAGLWQFATLEIPTTRLTQRGTQQAWTTLGLASAGLDLAAIDRAHWIKPFERTLSHRHVRFVVYDGAKASDASARALLATLPPHAAERRWASLADLAKLPLTTPQGMILEAMAASTDSAGSDPDVHTTVVRKVKALGRKSVGEKPVSG